MTGKILISDYTVTATHGVNPEEKTEAQPFAVSAVLYRDITEAAKCDDVDKTTSYSAICKAIKAYFEQNCFDLLERLACGTADLILKKFEDIRRAEVTVKKPKAPMKGVFDHVGVSVDKQWTECYLSLGSNMGDRNAYLDAAVGRLSEDDCIRVLAESSRLQNAAYGGAAHGDFVNSVLRIETLYSPMELLGVIHSIESGCGRVRDVRWGDRTLDIDVLFFGDMVYDEGDLIVPHPDMHNREFVLAPMCELAPYKRHPLTGKRMRDMLCDLKSL